MHPWVQEFYLVLGLGSGGSLLGHFQTPTLYQINFSPSNHLLCADQCLARGGNAAMAHSARDLLVHESALLLETLTCMSLMPRRQAMRQESLECLPWLVLAFGQRATITLKIDSLGIMLMFTKQAAEAKWAQLTRMTWQATNLLARTSSPDDQFLRSNF